MLTPASVQICLAVSMGSSALFSGTPSIVRTCFSFQSLLLPGPLLTTLLSIGDSHPSIPISTLLPEWDIDLLRQVTRPIDFVQEKTHCRKS